MIEELEKNWKKDMFIAPWGPKIPIKSIFYYFKNWPVVIQTHISFCLIFLIERPSNDAIFYDLIKKQSFQSSFVLIEK